MLTHFGRLTGLDRTQQYLVACGELDPYSTRPDSGVAQCQPEETETSSAAVTATDLKDITESTTSFLDESNSVLDKSSNSKQKSDLPSYGIGRLARIFNSPPHVTST